MRVAGNIRVNITLPSDIPRYYWSSITGSKFLPDGRLILCDTSTYTLKLLSRDFDEIDSLSFRYDLSVTSLWDVAVVNDSTVIITFPVENRLQFIQVVPRLQRGRMIDIGANCYGVDQFHYGIDVFDATIYLPCYDGRIRLLDLDGHSNGVLSAPFQEPYYVTVSRVSGNIYVSDYKSRSVTCLSPAGTVLFTYQHPSLNTPLAVLLDDLDNMIVADWIGDCVQIIENTDKTYRNLLTSDDGIIGPITLAYRRDDKRLVVGLQSKDWFSVVKLAN